MDPLLLVRRIAVFMASLRKGRRTRLACLVCLSGPNLRSPTIETPLHDRTLENVIDMLSLWVVVRTFFCVT